MLVSMVGCSEGDGPPALVGGGSTTMTGSAGAGGSGGDGPLDASPPDAAPIELEPGHWLELASTRLDAVGPADPPPGASGLGAVVRAWSGAAFDTTRDRLIVWGGGHADYAGNEVYAFRLDSRTWERLWGPTPNSQIPNDSNSYEIYDDGNPSSRHTYDGLVYLPAPADGLWNQGGSRWKGGSSATAATWLFGFGDVSWHRLADMPDAAGGYPRAALDPVTGHVFHRNRDHISEYDPVQDAWTVRWDDAAQSWSDSETAAVDPIRRKMYLLGGCQLTVFDLESHAVDSVATTGSTEILCARAPGFVYYPPEDSLVAWSGEPGVGLQPADVYVLDPVGLQWSRRSPAPTNEVEPSPAAPNGTFGRFRYSVRYDVFVLVNSVSENVFLLRL